MSDYTDREGKFFDWLHDEQANAISELREFSDEDEDQNSYANGYETGRLHAIQAARSKLNRLIDGEES